MDEATRFYVLLGASFPLWLLAGVFIGWFLYNKLGHNAFLNSPRGQGLLYLGALLSAVSMCAVLNSPGITVYKMCTVSLYISTISFAMEIFTKHHSKLSRHEPCNYWHRR